MTDTTGIPLSPSDDEMKISADEMETKALEDAKVSLQELINGLSDENVSRLVDYIPQLLKRKVGGFY